MSAPLAFVATPEQERAIRHELGPLLVVAGAGTGKTSVMAERIAHLVATGRARPDQVLGLTFTNKAAGNLKARVAERLGPDADIAIATYHSFGAGLVADHAMELDLEPGTQLLNRAQAWQLLFTVFDEFRFRRRSAYVPRLIVDDALLLASRCSDFLVGVDAVVGDCDEVVASGRWARLRETAAKRLELCQVVAAYDRRKRERNLIDFGDQLTLAVRLLRQRPDLAAELREQHPVVLLDEYQDTNFAQRVLLQQIYPEGSAITAVGDDMQSIYGFRGAHLGNILEFPEHFPPATVRNLETNRRSGPELVALANRIQAQVARARDKALVALEGAPGTVIECFVAADDAAEADEVARDVAHVGPPWAASAVLCRKRRLIGALVDALERRGVPVEAVGAGGLLDRPEIVDLVAWLQVLAHRTASVALLRILRGPRYRIGWRDLAAVARHGRALGRGMHDSERRPELGDALRQLDRVEGLSSEARARLAAYGRERDALGALARRLSVLDLAEEIAQRTGLWSAAGDRGRENLLRFFDLAARFAPVDGDPGLLAFVEYLALLDESDDDLAEAHHGEHTSVRVMTVHQAKGLEFANVWVPGLAGGAGRGGGIFPDSRTGENPLTQAAALPWWVRPDDGGMPHWRGARSESAVDAEVKRRRLEEEWRLFYVACTRARRRLVCSAAHWYPGPASPQGPSTFYEFVAGQRDIVAERFRQEPATVDPAEAARERRRAATAASPEAGEGGGGHHPPGDAGAGPVRAAEAGAGPAHHPPGGHAGAEPVRAAEAGAGPTHHLPGGARAGPPPRGGPPTSLSVTSLVSYARCPLQFHWSVVRPLPRVVSPAARLGIEVHRWIEEGAGRPLGLRAPPGSGEPGALPEHRHAPGGPEGFRASFRASPFASLVPVKVEAPFELALDGRVVRGRVDAVYEREGRIELVDFKTGAAPPGGDGGAHLQLDLYGLAAVEAWGVRPDTIRATYCYLRPDGPPQLVSRDWHEPTLAQVRRRLSSLLAAVAAPPHQPTPGAWCAGCEFLPFCPAGQEVTGG